VTPVKDSVAVYAGVLSRSNEKMQKRARLDEKKKREEKSEG